MSEVTVKEIQDQIDIAKGMVARRDMAERLVKNADFKALILDEFCTKECARYVQNSMNPAMSDRDRADSLAMAQAGGFLRRWLEVINVQANVAEREIAEAEKYLEEIRAES